MFLLLLLSASCGNGNAEIERLSRIAADSLFHRMQPALERELDSICSVRAHTTIDSQLDSIIEARKAEILKLRQSL
ncbi:MAG: hypothetical protein IT266_12135 [Saprospiraceae bacterium]|nr:hypothetical protein [Saprospiraceae bacterium]